MVENGDVRLRSCLSLVFLLLTSLLSGCAPSLDAEQARLCRMLLPALVPEENGITIISNEAIGGRGIHVTFKVGEATRERLISCRFGGKGFSAAKRDLVAVELDGNGLGEMQIHILKDRWLESLHAVPADPGRLIRSAPISGLSRAQALGVQHLVNALPRIGILALLALATALIYGLTFRINLAFGEFAAYGGIGMALGVLVGVEAGTMGIGSIVAAALCLSLAMAALAGRVVGKSILWPLSTRGGQPMLVAGVGLMVAVQEALRLAQGAGTTWLAPVGGEALLLAEGGGFPVLATPRLLFLTMLDLVAICLTLILMRFSRFGRAWQASADDPVAAGLMGINPRGMLIRVSALATMLAGLAGATITINYGGMHFSGGTMLGLTALIAAILGGIGSLGGAVIGACVIGLFQTGWSALREIAQWELASFMLLTITLVLKPGGFFGYADGASRKV